MKLKDFDCSGKTILIREDDLTPEIQKQVKEKFKDIQIIGEPEIGAMWIALGCPGKLLNFWPKGNAYIIDKEHFETRNKI